MLKKLNIQGIVLEEINKYFNSHLLSEGLFEDAEEGSEDDGSEKPKEKMSAKEKFYHDQSENYEKREKGEADSNNAESARKFLSHECINASKVLERATGLDPTSASSEASKYISGEWPITRNLVETINEIKAELNS